MLRNNIFAFNREHQLMRTRAEPHKSFTMENKIVYFDQGNLLGTDWGDEKFAMRQNVYYDTRRADISFAGKSFAEWQSSGQDRDSIVADPLFVNAGNFDFRVRPESLARREGFHQIDMSSVGPRVRAGADAWSGHGTYSASAAMDCVPAAVITSRLHSSLDQSIRPNLISSVVRVNAIWHQGGWYRSIRREKLQPNVEIGYSGIASKTLRQQPVGLLNRRPQGVARLRTPRQDRH
jgi:hypothetical protein